MDFTNLTEIIGTEAEADICRTYLLYILYAKDIANLYLDSYCDKCNKDKKEILKWLPVIAGARLCENKSNEVETLLKLVDSD